jgi:hypothetical protein
MYTIKITNQKGFDELPSSFQEFTKIAIISGTIAISRIPLNSTVKAYGNSTVKAYGNSTVEAYDNSMVKAWDNSTVKAWDNSTVEAYDNSMVKAYDNSTVKAYGYSTVVGHHASVIICMLHDNPDAITVHDDAREIITKQWLHTVESFIDCYMQNVQNDGRILLYKSVKEDLTDFFSGRIKYEGIVRCPDWDPNPNRECGGGLHLSPTPELALWHNEGKILQCLVRPDDFVVYPTNIKKVRCREVEVINGLAA